MDPLFQIPEDLGALDAAGLQSFIDAATARLSEVSESPAEFVTDQRPYEQLKAEVETAIAAVKEARSLAAAFEAEEPAAEGDEVPAEGDEVPAEETPAEGDEVPAEGDEVPAEAEAAAAEIAALAAEGAAEPEAVTASATRRRGTAPARSRAAAPVESVAMVPLTAAAGAGDRSLGSTFESMADVARTMISRRRSFGDNMPEGADNVSIAVANWSDLYPEDRKLIGLDEEATAALIAAVVSDHEIRSNFELRRKQSGGSLVASGGLCAPVTPYYNLQMISVAERPVRAALPAFNADRGGIRAARPAALSAITTGVGQLTAGQDAAGATKTCQSVDCPAFTETDVEILYHCLRFGNLGARTFPERVAQWNNLVLAAHARLAERMLLTGIDSNSTAVTADSLGLGASASLLSQILVAAAGMRSRHRMDPGAVLRVMLPMWVLDLLVSDVYRSQFQRFEMTQDKFVALLRAGGVEPTFYIDSAANRHQEFDVQNAGNLETFPTDVVWYLFPEGSFLYLDGGTLELGLVRDSVLNSTNDFEIFGESFENVAFIGVESLAVISALCDTGITAGTHNPACPYSYGSTS
jgi:hypothetical protein